MGTHHVEICTFIYTHITSHDVKYIMDHSQQCLKATALGTVTEF